MIKFVDENGNIFEGQSPYIHWLKGGQSIGLWYDLKLLIITDNIDSNSPLICTGLDEDSVFRFVKPKFLEDAIDISEDSPALSYEYVDTSNNIVEVDGHSYRLYQIHILCKSDKIGQITDSINLSIGDDSVDITIGGDFYTLDETLSINLSNRGLDLSPYIEKSLYDVNVHEANIDSIYINQKFKELVSNYIDIIDCKGSYKSLLNSLEWFDWGDNIEIYEVWKNSSDTDFEKNLELILSDAFKHLIYTQSKTTYVSLVTALTKPVNVFDEEKNPVLRDIVRKWSNDDLAIKISVLAAFFERYFLPIHMDLKRASVEAHIYTVQDKIKVGGIIHNDDYLTDSDPVSIDMPHTVVIGNLDGISVGDNTMFGRVFDPDHYEDFVDDVEFDTIYTFNFEDKSIEYWKEYFEYTDDSVDEFIKKCDDWAIKFTKSDETINYDGKTYSIWNPVGNDLEGIIYGIIDEDSLNNNYKYLNSKSIYSNLDNRYAPFSNFLVNVNGSYESGDDTSGQKWIEGEFQSLITVIKKGGETETVTETVVTKLYTENYPLITDEDLNNYNAATLNYFTYECGNLDNINSRRALSVRLWTWGLIQASEPNSFDYLNGDELLPDVDNPFANEFVNTGQIFEYGGESYLLWSCISSGDVLYALTTPDIVNKSEELEDKSIYYNINNWYCPFIAILDSDLQTEYETAVFSTNGNFLLYNFSTDNIQKVVYKQVFNKHTHYTPVGVDYVENIEINENELTDNDIEDIKQATAYGQLIGSVGVVVPVKVTVCLPENDGLCMEVINLYKDGINNPPIQVINRKLFMSENGQSTFNFNLVSTKLEKVSFTLTLYSLSGHTWTAAAGYEVIDVSGCQLDIYKVTNKDYFGTNSSFWDLMKGNPWGTQYNTIQTVPYTNEYIDPDKYTPQNIIQYLPMNLTDEMKEQYNEYIIVNNPYVNNHYDISWYTNSSLLSASFWNIPWGKVSQLNETGRYSVLVSKNRGIVSYSTGFPDDDGRAAVAYAIYNAYQDSHPSVWNPSEEQNVSWSGDWDESNIKKKFINRHDYIFIPQLHEYTNMEDMTVKMWRNKYSGEFDFGGYEIQKDKELLCVRPQFNHSIPVDLGTVRWEFKNMTTLETISYDIPISKPTIANNTMKSLGPGYWTVTMYFKMDGNSVEHKIVKNSAFKIV